MRSAWHLSGKQLATMNSRANPGTQDKVRFSNGSSNGSAPDSEKPLDLVPQIEKKSLTLTAAEFDVLHRTLADRQFQLASAWKQIRELRHDVADLAQQVAQERQFGFYDSLTQLPNRRLLMDRFDQEIARGARQKKKMALLFVDLDGFKDINDSLGHAAGDELLKQVAVRLVAFVRKSDTVCRYGGDEFVILLTELSDQASALSAVAKLRREIAKPFTLNGKPVHITASIGVAIYPIDGARYERLIKLSDLAMYSEKARRLTQAAT
jgi:diguanylate cyclase (GGDEF)-like protein